MKELFFMHNFFTTTSLSGFYDSDYKAKPASQVLQKYYEERFEP